MRMARMTPLLCMCMFMACAAEEPPPSPDPAPVESPATSVAISADWQNGSLSFLDADALLAPGGTFEDALIERMPLAAPGEQGPLNIVTTADGTLAIVLRSNGVMAFVGARIGIDGDALPTAGSGVVIVDVETRQVVADFPTADLPIMAALDRPRNRVFVSLFGGTGTNGSIAVYDLDALELVEQVEVAPAVEGLAINDAGTRGAVIGAGSGLYLFDPADVAGTLSQTPLKLSDDSSGVTFVSGTERAVVANSVNPSNFAVVDASDLDAPVVIDEGDVLDAVPYMIGAVPNREEVVMPVAGDGSLRLFHLDVSQTPARTLHEIEVDDVRTFPQAVTVDPAGRYAFIGAAGSKELLIFDLRDGGVQRRPWLGEAGPTALAVTR